MPPPAGSAARGEASTPSVAGELERALGIAFAYLNRRERSSEEMRLRLQREELQSGAVDAALERLTEQGYLDDARYARLFAQDKRELEDWGEERIRRSLRARGIERELIEAAVREEEGSGERGRAIGLLQRRFPLPPSPGRERERAFAMLIRKGYDSEIAAEAVAAHAREQATP